MNNYAVSFKNNSRLKWLATRLDLPLVLIVAVLLAFGLLILYSSTVALANREGLTPETYVVRQFVFMGIGIIGGLMAMFFPLNWLKKLAFPMLFVITIILGLMVITHTGADPNRSLFDQSIRPAELAKLIVLIYLATWLSSKRDNLQIIVLGIIPMGAVLGVVGGLILLQPDLSAGATILLLGGVMYTLANGRFKHVVFFMTLIVICGFFVMNLKSDWRERWADYVNGFTNPAKASEHVSWASSGVVKGGTFGMGLGMGQTKLVLPLAWTDSIFVVVVEELGLVGATFTVGLFCLLLWRGLVIARNATGEMERLLASGVAFWIFIEAAIHMGVLVNWIPFAGNSLPFFSLGGTSLVVNLIGIGLILNVARTSKGAVPATSERKTYGATINVRRRDRRGRVSRPDGLAGSGK